MASQGKLQYARICLHRVSVIVHFRLHTIVVSTIAVLLVAACTPTVKVATDEPITINLNVNIKHEIRIKVDKELEDLFSDDSELF